jgi:hypothetical protein
MLYCFVSSMVLLLESHNLFIQANVLQNISGGKVYVVTKTVHYAPCFIFSFN